MSELTDDFRDLLRLLNQHHVRYLIAGGFALAAHGHPRYTKDLDVWLDTTPDNADRVLAALDEFGFSDIGLTRQDFTEPDAVIQLGYEPNRIDLLTGLTGVNFQQAYPQHITATLSGIEAPVIDRDSLIANKRALGRPQDHADIQNLTRDVK